MARRRRTQKGSGILNRVKDLFAAPAPAAAQQEPVPVPDPGTPPSGLSNWEVIQEPPMQARPVPLPETPPLVGSQNNLEALLAAPTPLPPVPGPVTPPLLTQNELNALLATPQGAPVPQMPQAVPVIPPLLPAMPAATAPAATAPPVNTPTNPISIAERNTILASFIQLLTTDPAAQATLAEQEYSKILFTLSYSSLSKKNRSTYYDLAQHIQDFQGSTLEANLGDIIKEGGFGTIYLHRTDPTKIIKKLKYNLAGSQTQNDFLNSALREVFIQYYLYNISPTSIPAIYSCAKDDISHPGYFYIEMEYLIYPWMDIYAYFNELQRQGFDINFNLFGHILYNVCATLNNLEERASFVHRDFKLNNIMINTQTLDIKIIDFGYTTIRIPNDRGDRSDFVINNYQPGYEPDAPARFQQDVGLFLIFFRQYYIDRGIVTDRLVRRFIETIIPPSIRGLTGYINAYNFYGNKFAGLNTEALTPIAVINFINEFIRGIQAGTIRGGHRSANRRTRRRRSVRRSAKRSKRM